MHQGCQHARRCASVPRSASAVPVAKLAEEAAVISMLEHLSAMYDTLYHEGIFVSDMGQERLRTATLAFGREFQRARHHARRKGVLAWDTTPKVHKTQRLPLMSTVLNPTYVQIYDEESQMGTTGRVWKMSMSGRYQPHVQKTLMVKRIVAFLLRLEL